MFEISVSQSGRNPRHYELAGIGENADFEEFADYLKNALINISQTELKESQINEGFDKNPRVAVDNKFGKSIYDVNPFGKIEFFARQDAIEVVADIYFQIFLRSPRTTGQYRSGNYVFVGNRLVARDARELRTFLQARKQIGFSSNEIIRFINVNPYARKLERYGVSKGKKRTIVRKTRAKSAKFPTMLVPNGAYHLAYLNIRRKYRGSANFIKFSFHKNGARGISIQSAPGFRTTFKTPPYTGQPYLYPMISLAFSQEGINRE